MERIKLEIKVKRLGIYIIYDPDSIIDRYIYYVLRELKNYLSYLIVVCVFPCIISGKEYIYPFADRIVFRKNKGYDAGAYKDLLCEILGWDFVYNYDELLLSNDTYYAPIVPFDPMFEIMDRKKCDYWGIIRHPGHNI